MADELREAKYMANLLPTAEDAGDPPKTSKKRVNIHWTLKEKEQIVEAAARLYLDNPSWSLIRLANHAVEISEVRPRQIKARAEINKWFPQWMIDRSQEIKQEREEEQARMEEAEAAILLRIRAEQAAAPPPAPTFDEEEFWRTITVEQIFTLLSKKVFDNLGTINENIKNLKSAVDRLSNDFKNHLQGLPSSSPPPTLAPPKPVDDLPRIYLVSFQKSGDALQNILAQCRDRRARLIVVEPGRDKPVIDPATSWGLFGEWGGHNEQKPYWDAFDPKRRFRFHGISGVKEKIYQIASLQPSIAPRSPEAARTVGNAAVILKGPGPNQGPGTNGTHP